MTHDNQTELKFDQLPLDKRLLEVLANIGWQYCTPIQAKTLPLLLAGKDIAGQAQTGTGKTAAYLLAIFNLLLNRPPESKRKSGRPEVVIISPTRELAIQIHKDAVLLSRRTKLDIALVYGGISYDKQNEMFNHNIDLIIATPGRLIDFYKHGRCDFSAIKAVVMDEADRMFDLGFIKDIRYLLRRMPPPKDRLNMLYSATLSHRVLELAYDHMGQPILIKINPEQITADKVKQLLYHVSNSEKILLLLGLLKSMAPARSMIFVNTKRTAEKVWGYLESNGFRSAVLYGDLPQSKRQRLFNEFSAGKIAILVATDLAGRGLHVPDVTHVFNYDLPQNREDYVHRVGRTARAGKAGHAISFACEEYVYSLMDIEQYIGSQIPAAKLDSSLFIKPKPPAVFKYKKIFKAGRSNKSRKNTASHAGGRRGVNRPS